MVLILKWSLFVHGLDITTLLISVLPRLSITVAMSSLIKAVYICDQIYIP